jgi:hypothetical protein
MNGAFNILIIASFLFTACTPDDRSAFEEIEQSMQVQEDAWNRGDLEVFMDAYWKNDELIFIGKRGLSKGWQTTLENYKKGYPDRASMGTLLFSNDTLIRMDDKVVFVAGQWTLFRATDTLQGAYSLTWEYLQKRCVITTDHSS